MLKNAEEALQLVRNDSLHNLIRIQLGILNWLDGRFDESLLHLNAASTLSVRRGDHFKKAEGDHYHGMVMYYKCEFDSALKWFARAEEGYSKLKNDSAIAKIKSHRGLIYSATGRYSQAVENIVESFRLQETTPGYRDLSLSIQFSSEANEQLYYNGKLEKDLESLHYLENTNKVEQVAMTEHNIGLDYIHIKEYEKAIPYLRNAMKHFKSVGLYTFASTLSEPHLRLGNYDSAIFYERLWIDEIKVRGTRIYLSNAFGTLASIYRSHQEWDNAMTMYDSAQRLNRKIGLKRSVAQNGKARASILFGLGRLGEALNEINQDISIARSIGCIKDEQEYLELQSKILTELRMPNEAAESLTRAIRLRDSIASGESRIQIATLQIQYETEKKNRELTTLQSQNKLNEAKIDSRNLQIALAFSLVAFVAILGSFYYYRYNQKKKSSDMLEVLLAEIHHRVKNNLQIISSLINLKLGSVQGESRETLQQLNGRIFSLGLIHEKLFQRTAVEKLRLDLYLDELSTHLIDSFSEQHAVTIDGHYEPLEVDVDQTMTCGLILNELLTNSLKHAFTTGQPQKKVSIRLTATDGYIRLTILDNGERNNSGVVKNVGSFGLRFVDQLVTSKLRGTWEFAIKNGSRALIQFPHHV